MRQSNLASLGLGYTFSKPQSQAFNANRQDSALLLRPQATCLQPTYLVETNFKKHNMSVAQESRLWSKNKHKLLSDFLLW